MSESKELFKFHLDKAIKYREERPLFFRRNYRWRFNSREYGYMFSKRGLFRGYIKYGVFSYLAYFYTKGFVTKMIGGGHHDDHGHGHH